MGGNVETKCKNALMGRLRLQHYPVTSTYCRLITLRQKHSFPPESSRFKGVPPPGRCVTQTEPVWQTINTHRKQARLVAYTGHTSNNKTPALFFNCHLKPLCISCEGPFPQLYSATPVLFWSQCFGHEGAKVMDLWSNIVLLQSSLDCWSSLLADDQRDKSNPFSQLSFFRLIAKMICVITV